MAGICYVVGAGDCEASIVGPQKEDYVIAVDGGFATLQKMGIQPDVVIGDFDSLGYEPEEKNIIKLKPEKDDTDLLYSVAFGEKKGYKRFYIYGGCGGSRISHTIANLQLLSHFSGLACYLFDKEEVTFLLSNGKVEFAEECQGYLSVFSVSDVSEGVWEQGLKYELENARLTRNYPIGVSNEFLRKKSFVSVEKGELLITTKIENLNYIKK